MTPCLTCSNLDPFGDGICATCILARQKGVLTKKCACGKQRAPTPVRKIGSRTWISCKRCLQTITQLS